MKKFKDKLPALVMIGPTVGWLMLFLLIPLVLVIGISFMEKNGFGGVNFSLSLDAYKQLVNPEYLSVFGNSFGLSLLTTIICLLVGYPFAYIIANAPQKAKRYLVLLVMLPFWINSMIRIYGWNTILRSQGIVNNLLIGLGIIEVPLELLYTDGAVLLGMVYDLLPFAVLPMYTSIEKIEPSLLEAASDLGAGKLHRFVRVIIPLTMPLCCRY